MRPVARLRPRGYTPPLSAPPPAPRAPVPRTPAAALALLLAAAPAAAQDWLPSGREALAGAALVGGAAALDRVFERSIPDGGGTRWEWATRGLNYGGRPHYAVVLLAGAGAAGIATGDDRLRDGAIRVTAGMVAAGVVNGSLKFGVGRERASTTSDPWRFRPLATDNRWQSFPSGHATVAFSLAAALAEETGEPWVAVLGYGSAALVGWSRVYDDKHWTSDVVAGALIGIAGGRGMVRLLREQMDGTPPELTIAPGWIAVRIPTR
jgi:membrane-associated phospholipid phosphatase